MCSHYVCHNCQVVLKTGPLWRLNSLVSILQSNTDEWPTCPRCGANMEATQLLWPDRPEFHFEEVELEQD